MSETLRFPVRSRDEPFDLFEFDAMTRERLAGDERRIVRQVGLDLALEHGSRIETVSDMLDVVASAGPQGRRAMVDRARTAIGMETLDDEQSRFRFEATQRAMQMRPYVDAQGRRLTECSAEGCTVMPTHPGGALRPVADRRWWCPRHRDRAGSEDHLPEPPQYVLTAGLALKPVGEEAERLRAEDEKVQAAHREKVERRCQEAERLDRLEREYRATLRPPAGLGG